jgi:PEP-CTERM motif
MERDYQMRLLRKLGIALAILALSTMAFAGTVNMTFNTASGSNSWGGFYTYPYHFTVGTSGTPDSLMCVSYSNEIYEGETWTANVYTVAGYGALTGETPLVAQELAYLYLEAKADGGSNPLINAEAWYINGAPISEPDPSALSGFVLGGTYPTVRVYVPIDGSQIPLSDGLPQTFLGSTPEPSTLLTLGSGLLGLAGLARKRFLN